MNREIKFRAWDWDAKQMLYHGIFLGSSGSVYTLGAMENDCGFDDCINETEHYPAMQYTGLKDKNGKEIYEGDIVTKQNDPDWHFIVEWDQEYCGFRLISHDDEGAKIGGGGIWGTLEAPLFEGTEKGYGRIVIGNIYEHPELLK